MSVDPDFKGVEEEYVFEVMGYVEVVAYSEEGAEELFKENKVDYILEAIEKGTLEIR